MEPARAETSRAIAAKHRFNVYVIELDEAVWSDRRFRAANPHTEEPKRCLYVGMTGRDPRERFLQHKRGYKACRYARQYGKWLRHRMFRKYNPMTYEDACDMEVRLARDLRRRGYAVWQN